MNDYANVIKDNQDALPEHQQTAAGKPVAGDIGKEHQRFLQTLFGLLDDGTIDPDNPKTFVKDAVYDNLSEQWQDKVDLSLINISSQIRLIAQLREQAGTEAIHLHTMVEQLWQMKQAIEEQHDVFIF